MSKHLQRDLEAVEHRLLAQSSIVEEMIRQASQALHDASPALAEQVIARENQVDEREVHIEEDCLKILALHQPVAVDLRRTAAILKINNDLERIADLAVNIAERAVALSEFPTFVVPAALDRMARLAIAMVQQSLDAFVRLDVQIARHVCSRDDDVDTLNREVIDEIYDIVRQQPHLIEPVLHFFSASRHVERIADHATNIAEDVIYLVEGEIARHKHEDAVISTHRGGPR